MGCRRGSDGAHGCPGGCRGIHRDYKHTDINHERAGSDGAVGSFGANRSEHVDKQFSALDIVAEHFDEHFYVEYVVDEYGELGHHDTDHSRTGRHGGGLRAQARVNPRHQPHEGVRRTRQRVIHSRPPGAGRQQPPLQPVRRQR